MLRLLSFAAAIATLTILAELSSSLLNSRMPAGTTTGPIVIAQACPAGACSGL